MKPHSKAAWQSAASRGSRRAGTRRERTILSLYGVLAVFLITFLATDAGYAAARGGGGGGAAAGARGGYGHSSGHGSSYGGRGYHGHGGYDGHRGYYGHRYHYGFYFGGPYYWPWYGNAYYYPPYYAPYYAPYSYEDPAPQNYAPSVEQRHAWYYCRALNAYYPYVTECPGAWERVPPYPPPG
ncbi:MAG: hypothetical protein ACXW2L_17275 [Burkholderiales bacterium]